MCDPIAVHIWAAQSGLNGLFKKNQLRKDKEDLKQEGAHTGEGQEGWDERRADMDIITLPPASLSR